MIPKNVINWIVERISTELKNARPADRKVGLKAIKHNPGLIIEAIQEQQLVVLGFASVRITKPEKEPKDIMNVKDVQKSLSPVLKLLRERWRKELSTI